MDRNDTRWDTRWDGHQSRRSAPQVSPRSRRGTRWALAAATVIAAVLTGCSTVTGQAVSALYSPNSVGGLPVTDGPSGLRSDAPDPTGDVDNTDNGPMDRLALSAVNDVELFWQLHYDEALSGTFLPITNLVSYDSQEPFGPRICGMDPYRIPNAFFCPRNRLMAWDRGVLVPTGEKFFGEVSIAALMAHEYGHAVQNMAGIIASSTPTVVREQQADCFAGNYIRWVAEGSSRRFTLSTGDGLNKVLAAAITIRDPILTPDDVELIEEGHGTALDRISAFQTGFVDGPAACAAIDLESIENSRGDLPLVLQADDTGAIQTGDAALNEQLLNALFEFLNTRFTPAQPPTLSLQPPAQPCPDAKPTAPTAYCPATNTISVDLPALQALGTPADEEQDVLIQGDNTALSVLTSRYMLALQHQRGTELDSASTALRTACLTGIAQRDMASGSNLVLTAGDLDEAVAGLLNNGLAASDVNGNTVPAGFTRIMAFRSGLLNPDVDACYERFP